MLLQLGFAFDQMAFNSILMGKVSLHCHSLPSPVTWYISKRYSKQCNFEKQNQGKTCWLGGATSQGSVTADELGKARQSTATTSDNRNVWERMEKLQLSPAEGVIWRMSVYIRTYMYTHIHINKALSRDVWQEDERQRLCVCVCIQIHTCTHMYKYKT